MPDFKYFSGIIFDIKGDSIISYTKTIFSELKIREMLRKIKR